MLSMVAVTLNVLHTHFNAIAWPTSDWCTLFFVILIQLISKWMLREWFDCALSLQSRVDDSTRFHFSEIEIRSIDTCFAAHRHCWYRTLLCGLRLFRKFDLLISQVNRIPLCYFMGVPHFTIIIRSVRNEFDFIKSHFDTQLSSSRNLYASVRVLEGASRHWYALEHE